MRKLIAGIILCTMCISGFAACGEETPAATPTPVPTTAPTPTTAPVEDTTNPLADAKDYLYMMYKDKTEATPADYTVVGVVNIDGVAYPVTWTVEGTDTINIVPGDDKMVTIDVDDKNPEEVSYTLKATLTDDKGATESVSFPHRVPSAIIIDEAMSYAEIVDLAYGLEDGLAMEETLRLFGTITKIDTAYSPDYKNITVTIAVAGKEDKPIMCYRLAGEGAEKLAVGDAITVEGIIKNYKGTIEFDKGCVLVGFGEHKDYSQLLEAAYALEDGLAMTEPCTMSGVISKIDTAYSPDYKNITVTIVVNGNEEKPVMCYRLAGEGAETLAIGDYITVTGIIKNYKGTIEFDKGCTLDAVVKGTAGETTAPEVTPEPEEPVATIDANALLDGAALLDLAYALEEGASLPVAAVATGVVKSIDTEYNAEYGNVTVTIVVNGNEEKPLMCFRLKGEGADKIAVGDTISVLGTIKNYKGTIEFDAGCQLVSADAAAAVAAYALADGSALEGEKTLTGVVKSIDTEYSEQYGNVTVTIVVAGLEDYPIVCFRMKGDDAATVAAGDTITVTGTLKNYKGTIEFDAGCTFTK